MSYIYEDDEGPMACCCFGNRYMARFRRPKSRKQEIYENGILIAYSWLFTDHKNHTQGTYSDADVHTYKNKVIVVMH